MGQGWTILCLTSSVSAGDDELGSLPRESYMLREWQREAHAAASGKISPWPFALVVPAWVPDGNNEDHSQVNGWPLSKRLLNTKEGATCSTSRTTEDLRGDGRKSRSKVK
jgi:hypothetical protein